MTPDRRLMAQALRVQESIEALGKVIADLKVGSVDLVTAARTNEGLAAQIAAANILTNLLRLDGSRYRIANEVMGIGQLLPDRLSAPIREALEGLRSVIAAHQEES